MEPANSDNGLNEPTAEHLGKPPSDFIIAYISCPQDSGRNYLGGILLTDWRTRPVEFSFVSPVKVSAMQRIIHGKTLDEAITVHLIARRLLTEATKKPDVVFVDSDVLLELQRLTDTPVAKLSRENGLAPQSNSISTVKFTAANGTDGEAFIGGVLSSLEPFVDLMDPFLRVIEAIKEAIKSIPPPQPKP